MTDLKYGDKQTDQEATVKFDLEEVPEPSPLYGNEYRPRNRKKKRNQPERTPEIAMLQEEEVIEALKYAQYVYSQEMMKLGYSPLTIGSNSSSVGRFIQFLECGRVIPDREQ